MTEEIIETIPETPIQMTAGEMLRNARTTGRRKREIPTISKLLCIREEFLQALEDCNYTFIPETVYILGFARNYAMELGLNPDEIVNKIKQEMGLVPDGQPMAADSAQGATKKGGASQAASVRARGMGIIRSSMSFVRRNWIWCLGGVLVLILAIVAISVSGRSDKNSATSDDNAAVVVAAVPEPEYSVKIREKFGAENAETANVILQAVQESWVKIEDARGNTVFSRVLVPGDVYYVPAGDKYKGTFGNAGGIDVWVNGQKAPAIGPDHTRKDDVSMAPSSLLGE